MKIGKEDNVMSDDGLKVEFDRAVLELERLERSHGSILDEYRRLGAFVSAFSDRFVGEVA